MAVYVTELVYWQSASSKGLTNFDETFSPVVTHSTLKLLFALSVVLHFDMKKVFMDVKLKEDIYI